MAPKLKRLKVKVDLITGVGSKKLPKSHLPSGLDVLRLYRYLREELKLSMKRSIRDVVSEVIRIWECAGLPHQMQKNSERCLSRLSSAWIALKKEYTCKHPKATTKRQVFEVKMRSIFNIADAQIMKKLKKDIPRASFWKKQLVAGTPVLFPESWCCPLNDDQNALELINEINRAVKTTAEPERAPDKAPETDTRLLRPRGKRVKLLNRALVNNLDRNHISNRGAVGVLAATAASAGLDPNRLTLSKSTMHRKRQEVRSLHFVST